MVAVRHMARDPVRPHGSPGHVLLLSATLLGPVREHRLMLGVAPMVGHQDPRHRHGEHRHLLRGPAVTILGVILPGQLPGRMTPQPLVQLLVPLLQAQ